MRSHADISFTRTYPQHASFSIRGHGIVLCKEIFTYQLLFINTDTSKRKCLMGLPCFLPSVPVSGSLHLVSNRRLKVAVLFHEVIQVITN